MCCHVLFPVCKDLADALVSNTHADRWQKRNMLDETEKGDHGKMESRPWREEAGLDLACKMLHEAMDLMRRKENGRQNTTDG